MNTYFELLEKISTVRTYCLHDHSDWNGSTRNDCGL